LIPTAITAGASRVAPDPLCLHAVATTPAGSMEPIRSYRSVDVGLPQITVGSAPASQVSRPAQRSLGLQPADLPSRLMRPSTSEAPAALLPPPPLRLLPGGAIQFPDESFFSLWTSAFSRRTEIAMLRHLTCGDPCQLFALYGRVYVYRRQNAPSRCSASQYLGYGATPGREPAPPVQLGSVNHFRLYFWTISGRKHA
jgi:hypothetical protein